MLLINTWSVASFSKGAVHLPEGLLAKPVSSILSTRKHGQFKSRAVALLFLRSPV